MRRRKEHKLQERVLRLLSDHPRSLIGIRSKLGSVGLDELRVIVLRLAKEGRVRLRTKDADGRVVSCGSWQLQLPASLPGMGDAPQLDEQRAQKPQAQEAQEEEPMGVTVTFYSTDDAAKRLGRGITMKRVQRWCAVGKVRAVQQGRKCHYMIPEAELERVERELRDAPAVGPRWSPTVATPQRRASVSARRHAGVSVPEETAAGTEAAPSAFRLEPLQSAPAVLPYRVELPVALADRVAAAAQALDVSAASLLQAAAETYLESLQEGE